MEKSIQTIFIVLILLIVLFAGHGIGYADEAGNKPNHLEIEQIILKMTNENSKVSEEGWKEWKTLLESFDTTETAVLHILNQAIRSTDDGVLRFLQGLAIGSEEQFGPAPTIKAMTENLKNKDEFIRKNALIVLSTMKSADAVKIIIKDLKNENASMRSAAVAALGKNKSTMAVQALVQALNDPDPRVRKEAVRSLGHIGSPEAAAALLPSFKDDDWDVRAQVLKSLEEMEAFSLVTKGLKDEDADIRRGSAAAFARMLGKAIQMQLIMPLLDKDDQKLLEELLEGIDEPKKIRPILVAAARGHKSIFVRVSALWILAKTQSEELTDLPIIIEASQDDNFVLKLVAIMGLEEIVEDSPSIRAINALVEAFSGNNPWVQQLAIEALGGSIYLSSELVPVFLKALNGTTHMKRWALWELGKVGSTAAVESLIQALKDSEPVVRESAADALGNIGSATAVPALSRALRDEDWEVRVSAASALRKIGSKDASPALSKALQDKHQSVRREAAQALAIFGSEEALPVLIKDLNYFDSQVRSTAAQMLAHIRSTQSVKALITTLRDKDSQVRAEAIRSLGKIGSPENLPALLETLSLDQQRAERLYLVDAIKTIDSATGVAALTKTLKDKNPSMRKKVAWLLGRIGSLLAVPNLSEMLRDEDANVRRSAAEALGLIGSNEAVSSLIGSLKDSNEKVVSAVARALGQLQAPEAIPPLAALLKNENKIARRSATRALGVIGSEEAAPVLIQALMDPDKMVREYAVHSLGRIGTDTMVPHLIEILRDEKSSLRKKSIAIDALGKNRSDQSVAALIDFLEDESSGLQAGSAYHLSKMAVTGAIPALVRLLKSPDPRLRVKAASALATFNQKEAVPTLVDMAINKTGTLLKVAQHLSILQIRQAAAFMDEFPEMPGYTANLQVFYYFVTADPIPLRRLAALNWVHGWNVEKENISPAGLVEDYERLRKELIGKEATFVENPYMHFLIAYVFKEKGDYEGALAWADKSLALLESGQNETALKICTDWIKAECLLKLGKKKKGLAEIEKIEKMLLPRLTAFESSNAKLPFRSYTLTLKGLLLSADGRIKESVLSLYQAEEILQGEHDITLEEQERIRKIILAYRARAQREGEKKDADESIRLADKAAARTRLERDAVRVALVTRIEAAVGEGDYELAHMLTEKLNLQTYSASIVTRGINVKDSARKDVINKLRSLQGQVEQLDKKVNIAESNKTANKKKRHDKKKAQAKERKISGELTKLRRARKKKQRELKKYIVGLKRTNPEVAVLLGAQPMEISGLQEYLDEKTAIVQYLPTDDKLMTFLVTQDDIKIEETPVLQKDLTLKVKKFRKLIQKEVLRPSAKNTSKRQKLGRELFTLTIGPVAKSLESFEQLVIIPAGALNYLPFAALERDGTYLIEKWKTAVLSASSLLAVLRHGGEEVKITESPLLAVANPTGDLKAAESEVSTIAGLFPKKTVFMGSQARMEELLQKDLRNNVLHLATHGHAGRVEDTFLKLSDGDLKVEDIWGLYLTGSPLVTLSACETSMGELVANEVVSLANGFIFAGTQSIVATLWPVADKSTRLVMERFYQGLNQGLSKAEALRQAQLSLLKPSEADAKEKTTYAPPFFWAPFVLIGNWG